MTEESKHSVLIKAAQKHHHLHAVRLNWLRWLSTPITAVWNFIADSFVSVWNYLVLTSWYAMKESLNYKLWILSGAGIFVSSIIILIFLFISLKTGISILAFIGILIGVLPVAWANSEIAAVISLKDTSSSEPTMTEIRQGMGTGMRSILTLFIFVAAIIILLGLETVLNLTGMIPHAGFIAFGILIVPLLILSAFILFAAVIIIFGTPLLGSH
ncbi:MAG: hypothetical protein OEZ34_09055, partial [Spirochaetia bacterium]|nr:hypothetical protein [Spirochaetia bacterium]